MVDPSRPPSVDTLATRLADDPSAAHLPRSLLVDIARVAVADARKENGADAAAVAAAAVTALSRRRPRRIVNATGVLLHTNLGRAPLHPEAAAAAAMVAQGYGNVELDLTTGARGGRHDYLGRLAASLTGAEEAVVVNNNAAALVLTLAAIPGSDGAGGAAVSRGELIEIGGSFRLPELMAASGATLVEVGTTNRTRVADYERVLDDIDLVLKVHPSNYRVEGFTESAGYRELAEATHRHGAVLAADIGSGLLDSRTPWLPGPPPPWLGGEPGARQTLEAGADLVLFSGDKLLGGPQAGIVVGNADLVRRLARHPLMRALRLDGPTLAALATTLELYGAGRGHEIPVWRMAALGPDDLLPRLERIATSIGGAQITDDQITDGQITDGQMTGGQIVEGQITDGQMTGGQIVAGQAVAGAGSTPGAVIGGPVLAISDDIDTRWERLLRADPPVLASRHGGRLLVDLRTVVEDDDRHVAAALTDR